MEQQLFLKATEVVAENLKVYEETDSLKFGVPSVCLISEMGTKIG